MAEIESSEAPDGQEREKDEREEKEVGEEDEDEEENNSMSELQSSIPSITVPDRSSFEAEFRYQSSQSETLAVPPHIPLSENDHDSDCPSFSQLLAGAMASPVANSTGVFADGLTVKPMLPTASVDPMGFPIVSPSSLLDPAGFKGQFGMSHQEVLASVTAQAQAHKQHQNGYPSSSSELSHVSVTQLMTSPPSSSPVQQKSPQVDVDNDVCMMEADEQSFCDQKIKPAQVVVKTPSTDGYNWRKYGQKQVKSTESSRSYYKCTYSDCHAKKKVERCDHSGRVIDTIYKGRHSHDPPRKIKSTRARRLVPSAVPVVKTDTIDCTVKKLDDSDPSTSKRETDQPVLQTPEQKLQGSSGSEMNAILKSEEHGEEPEAKKRIKESNIACSAPHFKTIKEPKIVVHATDDVGISGDGYRWRKYGQKMVKGNPHPRSYYKCTSAGCPVRKHVERATDDTTAIIITYEGKHDHDMPVPKKRHGPPSAALLIAAAAAMNNAQFKKTDTTPNQRSSNQWSMDVESESVGEKALELGGEKALESARTLLSIGIELKPW